MKAKETENYNNLSDKNYGSFLKISHEHRGIKLGQLAKGLCAKSMASDIENGNKSAGWQLRERLLRRCGVASDAYESHLNYEDYTEWEMQEKILDFWETKNTAQMAAALENYTNKYTLVSKAENRQEGYSTEYIYSTNGNVMKRLRRQFYLGMLGMCRKLAGAEAQELAEIFFAAVCQSIPEFGKEPLCGLVLCPEEINLILEYAQCLPIYEAQKQCQEIQSYLQDAQIEDDAIVLNYPKTILIQCQLLWKKAETGISEYEEIINLCDHGIDLLRKTQKSYYLQELLMLKKNALKQLQKQALWQENLLLLKLLTKKLAELDEWQRPLDMLCQRFGGGKWGTSDAFLYRSQDTYYVGTMIRARRKMLGMTQAELIEGICTLDTLQDLEGKRRSTQPYYIHQICERLKLSPVCDRTELVTANPRARELEKAIRYAANNRDFKKNLEQLEELKTLIDTSNPINQQWVLRTEGMARYQLKLIDEPKYTQLIKQALECTLPVSVLEFPEEMECYLTNSEMECIYHYSLLNYPENSLEADKRMKIVFHLEKNFKKAGKEKNHIRTFELYMEYKASLLYEQGYYEQSQQYAENIIQLCLQTKRINLLSGALYDWMRSNQKLQKEKAEPAKSSYDWKKDLNYCITLSWFCQNDKEKNFLNKH